MVASLEVIELEDGGHYYMYDNRRVPGISEILEAADVLLKNSFYEERAAAAAVRGRDVHLACADLDRGSVDWWSDDPEIGPYLKAYKQFKEDFSFRPTAIERPVYHEVYRYAGTPDRFGNLELRRETHLATVEIKATSVIGCHVPLQLAAQNLFCDDHEERETIALQLKPNGKYGIQSWNPAERRHNEAVFLACLTLTMWKQRHHSNK